MVMGYPEFVLQAERNRLEEVVKQLYERILKVKAELAEMERVLGMRSRELASIEQSLMVPPVRSSKVRA